MNAYSKEEAHYRVLRLIEQEPELTQREMAGRLGISLGKANYLLNALIKKGLIKARNFKNSKNKAAYAYYLTPDGIEEKARVTLQFLSRKEQEYEALRQEIEDLGTELASSKQRYTPSQEATPGFQLITPEATEL